MQAKELMTSPVKTISLKTTAEEAARIMIEDNVSCLPVLGEDGSLAGIITHSDLIPKKRFLPLADHIYSILGSMVSSSGIEEAAQKLGSRKVEEVMTSPVVTTDENVEFSKVAQVMVDNDINRLPVMKNGLLSGIITRHDLLKAMI
tara:strand:- start:88 stop:525 length:438 start_codon:yes stop_codon:yes gene_type:complete